MRIPTPTSLMPSQIMSSTKIVAPIPRWVRIYPTQQWLGHLLFVLFVTPLQSVGSNACHVGSLCTLDLGGECGMCSHQVSHEIFHVGSPVQRCAIFRIVMASCIACILAFWVPPDEVAAEFSLTALDPEASRPREIKHWRAICQGRCVCVCALSGLSDSGTAQEKERLLEVTCKIGAIYKQHKHPVSSQQ